MPWIKLIAFLALSLLACVVASAQPAPPPTDISSVLQAIQGLRNEIKTLREDVTVLKRKVATQPPAAAPEAQPAASEAKPRPAAAPKVAGGRLEAGWIVWAYDFPCCWNVNFNADPLGGFPLLKTKLDTAMHEKSISTSNNLAYKAEGFFSAGENGKYTFTVSFSDNAACGAGLEIDGTTIIPFKVESRSTGQTLQGSKEINATSAKIAIYYGCNPGYGPGPKTIKLLVRAPGDLLPRDLSINEISHKVGG